MRRLQITTAIFYQNRKTMAARDHFERVSCKLYKNIWTLKSQRRR